MASKERKRQNTMIRKNSLASSIADLSEIDRSNVPHDRNS